MSKIALIMFAAAIALLLSTGIVIAKQHEASVEKGKVLFNDHRLGTNGKTCNDCHKGGFGLELSGARKDVTRIVNACIQESLKGKVLKPKSVKMQSLVLYLKSLGGGKKTTTKKTPVGC